MYKIHIRHCGTVFTSEIPDEATAMETYKLLRRRNIKEIAVYHNDKMLCGTGDWAQSWHLPEYPQEEQLLLPY